MSITVNILANNEEKTIRTSIDSVVSQTVKPDRIVVVANGCTDMTAEVARQYAEVIELEQASKPGAWNAAREACDTTYISFMDGDAALRYDALEKQLAILSNGFSAVGGMTAFYKDGLDWLSRFGTDESLKGRFLPGAFYTCRRQDLDHHLKRRGFNDMPDDIINEDHWLSMVIGKGNFMMADDAVAYCVPASWKDRHQQKRRLRKGALQIKSRYADLCSEYHQDEGKLRGNVFKKLRHAKELGLPAGASYLLKYTLYKIAVYSAGLADRARDMRWNSAASTKMSIPRSVYSG